MRVLFLTEGGRGIGFGHMTRCLAIWQGIRSWDKKASVFFAVNAESGAIVSSVLGRVPHAVFPWHTDVSKTSGIAAASDFVVIDSYLGGRSLYESISREKRGALLMVDDYKRMRYPGGIVMNPSVYGRTLRYPARAGVRYLLGSRYIIMRREFWDIPCTKISGGIKTVLITLGGSRRAAELKDRLVEFLRSRYDFKIRTVGGPSPCSAAEVRALMLGADVCISAGGQTLYELARLGVPTVAVRLADNQALNIGGLHKRGLIEYAGRGDSPYLFRRVAECIDTLAPYRHRLRMSARARSLIDGQGARRAGRIIAEYRR